MQFKYLNRILLLLVACCLKYSLTSNVCVQQCLMDACKSYEDYKICAQNILKELKEVQANCSPSYRQSCVFKYCKSEECQDLIDCSEDCDLDLKQLLNFELNIGGEQSHQSLKNNHHLIKNYGEQEIQNEADQSNYDNYYDDDTLDKSRSHHGHGKHKKNKKRHGLNGQLLLSILSPMMLIFVCI